MTLSIRALIGTSLMLCALLLGAAAAQAEEKASAVGDGNRVSIEYTLKLGDGTLADTNVGGEPLTYTQGESQILPSLESELLGMKIGESKHVSLTSAQGYGEVDESLFQTVPTADIPADARQVGAQLVAQSPAGQQRPVRVREVKEDVIVMDLNHPLAGQALTFDIKILAIE